MANRDPKNVKRIIENISKKAAKKVYGGEGGDVEGVKVVDELPETGKDGDLVLVKKATSQDIDISNVEFDVYIMTGAKGEEDLLLVDKNEAYSNMLMLNQAIGTYIEDLITSGNVLWNAPQGVLLTEFQTAYEQGLFEIVQNKEEIIGKAIKKAYIIKQGTCKFGELNFVELDDPDSYAYEEAYLCFIYGNKLNGFTTDITIRDSDVTKIQYEIRTDLNGIVTGFDTDLELHYKLIRTLDRGEVFDFSVDAEQTYNWMNEAQLEGFDSIAMNGGCVVKEPEYDYKMYVYYDNQFNEIPSGAEAETETFNVEDYTLLAASNYANEYELNQSGTRSFKFKGVDALIEVLTKSGIDVNLPFCVPKHSSTGNSLVFYRDTSSGYEFSMRSRGLEGSEDYNLASFKIINHETHNLINSFTDTILSFLTTNKAVIDSFFCNDPSHYLSEAEMYNLAPNRGQTGNNPQYTCIYHCYYKKVVETEDGYDDTSKSYYYAINVRMILDLFEPVE